MVSARHARRHAGIRVSLGTARTYTSSPWPAPVQINKKSRRREEREGRIPRPALARARAAERHGKRTVCLHGEQSNLHQEELGAVVGGSSAGSAQKSSAAAVQPKNRGANAPPPGRCRRLSDMPSDRDGPGLSSRNIKDVAYLPRWECPIAFRAASTFLGEKIAPSVNSGRRSPGLWDRIAGDSGARRPKGCHEKFPKIFPPSETSRSFRRLPPT